MIPSRSLLIQLPLRFLVRFLERKLGKELCGKLRFPSCRFYRWVIRTAFKRFRWLVPVRAGGEMPPLRRVSALRCRGGLWPPAVHRQAKQHGTGQADPVGAQVINLRPARAQWPGRRGRSHSGFARRKGLPAKGAGKNGVLVPLPLWAKEPAAGAAESLFPGKRVSPGASCCTAQSASCCPGGSSTPAGGA